MKRFLLCMTLAACGGHASPAKPAETSAVCLADHLGPLQDMDRDGACTAANDCVARCEKKDAPACLEAAYATQRIGDEANAQRYYAKSCEAGFAAACTNYGAGLWAHGGSDADVACATKLFERTCATREVFGCGMQGRMLAEHARTDEDRVAAKKFFDGVCNDIGGPTCRMYALHLEAGELGPTDAALSKALMIRACATGDDDACDHETATETFH